MITISKFFFEIFDKFFDFSGGLQAATVLTGGVAILGTAALLAALAAGRGGRAGRRRGKRSIEEQVRQNTFRADGKSQVWQCLGFCSADA